MLTHRTRGNIDVNYNMGDTVLDTRTRKREKEASFRIPYTSMEVIS